MSVRRALIKVWSVGRILIRRPPAQTHHPRIALPKEQARGIGGGELVARASPSRVQRGYETARRIFANTVLSRVGTNVSAELRNRTTRQLLFGNSTPFFAFVGLSLATGSIITKEDELEGLCLEIRSSIERLHKATAEAESDLFAPNETIGISNFTFGPYIGKGANAAIYCAKKKENDDTPGPEIQGHLSRGIFPFAIKMMFNYGVQSNAFLIMNKMANETLPARTVFTQVDDADDQPAIENLINETVSLPPHPNIVSMHSALADYVPEGLPEALSQIPEALPVRLNSQGFGRNMTMFLIMKRYDTNLKAYLAERALPSSSTEEPPEVRESILLLAQLLEGVAHINRYGIAHRDLKSDNVLLDLGSEGGDGRPEIPRLVLTDFGCCFYDADGRFLLPYHTRHTDRGGNPALMAPEVVNATPGPFTFIDYSKSDAWAVGAIAYELFTGSNPFYPSDDPEAGPTLFSRNYQEKDLPSLPSNVPTVVHRLVRALLARSPSKRPSAEMAADVLQLYLWAPSSWTKSEDLILPSYEILQWLLTLTTKVLTTDSFGGRRSQAEYQLISSFLRRIKLERVRAALAFIRNQ